MDNSPYFFEREISSPFTLANAIIMSSVFYATYHVSWTTEPSKLKCLIMCTQ